jgi:hypothetical protein
MTVARANRASWTFKIPAKARIGSASATVKCGRAGKISRSFAVVGPPAAPAKVLVKKSGFSQRVRSIQREVSYGVVLSNDSPEKDALAVSVIINFIDSTNRVVATQSEIISAIGAGTNFYLGGSTTIPDSTPVSTLEIDADGGQDIAWLSPPTSTCSCSGRSTIQAGSGGRRPDHERSSDDAARERAVYTVSLTPAETCSAGARATAAPAAIPASARTSALLACLDPDPTEPSPQASRSSRGTAHQLVLWHGPRPARAGREAFATAEYTGLLDWGRFRGRSSR